jgi:flagellar hook-length control protein FliK
VDLVIAGFFQVPSASPAQAAGGAEPDAFVPDVAFAAVLDLAACEAADAEARDSRVAVPGDEGRARAEPFADAEAAGVPDGGAALSIAACVSLVHVDAAPRHAGAGDVPSAPADPSDDEDDEDGERDGTDVSWHSVPVAVAPRIDVSIRQAVQTEAGLDPVDAAAPELAANAAPDAVATREPDVVAPGIQRRDREAPGPVSPQGESAAVRTEDQTIDTQSIDAQPPPMEHERTASRAARSLARALARVNGESVRPEQSTERQYSAEPRATAQPAGMARAPEFGPAIPSPDTSVKAASPAQAPTDAPSHAPRAAPTLDGLPLAHGVTASTAFHTTLAVAPAAASPPTLEASHRAAEEPEIVPQLVRAMRTQFRGGIGEARIRLHPEHLGEVRVSVRIDGDRVSTLLQVERADVQRAIESQSETLRAGLTAQGFTLEHLSVRQEDAAKPPAREDAEPRGHPREQATPRRRSRKRQPDREFEIEE